jgi:tetraacyldisaccharide 4'-kinase
LETATPWARRLQQAWSRRTGLAWCLLPIAVAFGAIAGLRRTLYRVGLRRPATLGVPVVVVGNLIAGGAGKTPTVLAVVQWLQRMGFTPGIVSRGHGGAEPGLLDVRPDTPVQRCGDEPLLLRLRSGAPVCVGRDRVAAGRALLRTHPQVDIVVSDDGLQHLQLARDAQVIVFDERGVGNGWLLPAGPLREPLPARVPPRSVVLYNAPGPSTPLPGWTAQRRLAGAVLLRDWWQGRPGTPEAIDALSHRPLVAAAGVAQPGRFFAMLREHGLRFTELPLPDHHGYATLPWPDGTPDVIVTEKDAVKLDPQRVGSTQVWVAALDFAPGAGFDAALAALLPPAPTRSDHGDTTA